MGLRRIRSARRSRTILDGSGGGVVGSTGAGTAGLGDDAILVVSNAEKLAHAIVLSVIDGVTPLEGKIAIAITIVARTAVVAAAAALGKSIHRDQDPLRRRLVVGPRRLHACETTDPKRMLLMVDLLM